MGKSSYTLQLCGVPMSRALTTEQQEVARLGLRIISTAYSNGLSIGAALAAAGCISVAEGQTRGSSRTS